MSDSRTGDGHKDAHARERARRGASDADPFEVIEGLQVQIDDLTRIVERHQLVLERLTSSELSPDGE